MQGMGLESIKKNPALIPLYVCVGLGMVGAALYTLRLATRNPDVSWSKKGNPEPWEAYREKQYKFYTTREKMESKAPKYE
uniref:Putative nadh dehydrogenase n=1 Tax=Corethrella appendiculata TaxID=1370023 RepID=U5ES15_9DIPT